MYYWFNSHCYALRTACRQMLRTPISTVLNWVVMSLVLAVPIIGICIIEFTYPFIKDVRPDPTLSVFLKIDATSEEKKAFETWLEASQFSAIDTVELKQKQDAWEEMQEQDAWKELLSNLSSNPFPDAYIIVFKQGTSADTIDNVTQMIKNQGVVDTTVSEQYLIKRLEQFYQFMTKAFYIITIVVVAGVCITVFNTVRMQLLSQRKEIKILRLVGATESFVCRPFLYFGALNCFASILLAFIFVTILIRHLNTHLHMLTETYGISTELEMPPFEIIVLFTLASVLLGVFSAFISTKRAGKR